MEDDVGQKLVLGNEVGIYEVGRGVESPVVRRED